MSLESYVTAPSDWESILDVGSGWTKRSTISDLLIQKQGYHHHLIVMVIQIIV